MNPPIFQFAAASAAVTDLLGQDPVRFFLFGEAPEKGTVPYAVWQTSFGSPENKLAGTPDADTWGAQVDCYAHTASVARSVAKALRDAFEPHGYVVSWNMDVRDPATRLWRYGFTVEFLTHRS